MRLSPHTPTRPRTTRDTRPPRRFRILLLVFLIVVIAVTIWDVAIKSRANSASSSSSSSSSSASEFSTLPTATTDDVFADGYPMVAVGDSTIALAPNARREVSHNGCQHNVHSWVHLVSQSLRMPLADLSCAGAKISRYWKQPLETYLGPNTRVVFVSMGSNDIRTVAQLIRAESAPGTQHFLLGASQEQVERQLREVLQDIRKRAPNARIITVGYLPLMPDGICPEMPNVTRLEQQRVHRMRYASDVALSNVSTGWRVYNIPMREYIGHGLCQPESSYIINHGKGVRYHYTNEGTRFISQVVVARYRELLLL